jgi:HEAT repeat protein
MAARACVAFPFAALVALFCTGGVAAQSVDDEIAKRIALVESTADTTTRIDRAAHLAEYIASRNTLDVSDVEPPIVDRMAELLDDDADLVRFYAAASLGFLGASARRAIPALERALARLEAERVLLFGQPGIFSGAVSSVQAICAALTKIDLSRVPAACQSYR